MIDWDRVSELRDEIGAEDFAEVVEIFLEEVEEELAKLNDGMAQDALLSGLHFLKGSALNLGFESFSDMCQDYETAARNAEAVQVSSLKATYASSKSEFLSALTQLDAA